MLSWLIEKGNPICTVSSSYKGYKMLSSLIEKCNPILVTPKSQHCIFQDMFLFGIFADPCRSQFKQFQQGNPIFTTFMSSPMKVRKISQDSP